VKIYDFKDYREFLVDKIKAQPKGGRGELAKMARHIRIHTTSLSQILRGSRDLSQEQAVQVSQYFGLNERESRYFLLLVQYRRAGSADLKSLLERQLDEMKSESAELVHRFRADKSLSVEEKATFYSNWFYSGIRVLTSIPGFQTPEAIADYFGLSRALVNEVIQFLLSSGLCVEKKGKLAPGPQYTHLDARSAFSHRHHSNWRIKAMQRHPNLSPLELAFSAPMSLSKRDVEKVKTLLVDAIESVNRIRGPSECEEVFCLNLDWFRVT